jgi:hypothetical protein
VPLSSPNKNGAEAPLKLLPGNNDARIFRNQYRATVQSGETRSGYAFDIPTSLKLTRACVITAHAMALSVMTEELTMKTMKLNIDLGKYVITGTKHDLILNERGIIKEGENAGKETLSRIGYYSKFEHLVKELCNREILLSQAQTLQDIQQHIETLGMSLSMAIDQFVESKS